MDFRREPVNWIFDVVIMESETSSNWEVKQLFSQPEMSGSCTTKISEQISCEKKQKKTAQ